MIKGVSRGVADSIPTRLSWVGAGHKIAAAIFRTGARRQKLTEGPCCQSEPDKAGPNRVVTPFGDLNLG